MRLRIGTVGMVTAAMVSVLTCYTLSLRVSAERSKVEELRGHIAGQMRDIRALEAELKTRSRLPQLQRWNDNVLALSAPTAKQYADNPTQLASFAPGAPKAAAVVPAVVRAPVPQPAANPLVHTASYTMPASPVVDDDADAEPAQRPAAAKPVLTTSLASGRSSTDKLRTSGASKSAAGFSSEPVRGEPVEPRVAPKLAAIPAPKPVAPKLAVLKPKAPDAKGLDNLFGDIDHAATAEHSKLVKVSLR